MVQKVVERGAGSQPARIEEVPIETLRAGDFVVSYNPYESVVCLRSPAQWPLPVRRTAYHIGSCCQW